jgi:hypothetical protein
MQIPVLNLASSMDPNSRVEALKNLALSQLQNPVRIALTELTKPFVFSLMAVLDDGFVYVVHMWR